MRKITRKMKKSLSLVLAMLMVFSVSSSNPPVHAEEPSATEITEVKVEDGKGEGKEDTVKEVLDVESSDSQYMEFHIQNDTNEEIVVSVDMVEFLTLGKGEIRPFYMEYQNGQKGTIRVLVNGKEYVLNLDDFFATGTVMVKKSAEGTFFFDNGTREKEEEIRFDHDYTSVSDMDFSTKQLLVGTGNKEVFTKTTNVVSEYEGIYLLQFHTVEETRSAYSYYVDKVDFIIADTVKSGRPQLFSLMKKQQKKR